MAYLTQGQEDLLRWIVEASSSKYLLLVTHGEGASLVGEHGERSVNAGDVHQLRGIRASPTGDHQQLRNHQRWPGVQRTDGEPSTSAASDRIPAPSGLRPPAAERAGWGAVGRTQPAPSRPSPAGRRHQTAGPYFLARPLVAVSCSAGVSGANNSSRPLTTALLAGWTSPACTSTERPSMFSFVPCVPAESTEDPRFPRPELRLHSSITSHLRQGKKITKLARLPDAVTLWRQVSPFDPGA